MLRGDRDAPGETGPARRVQAGPVRGEGSASAATWTAKGTSLLWLGSGRWGDRGGAPPNSPHLRMCAPRPRGSVNAGSPGQASKQGTRLKTLKESVATLTNTPPPRRVPRELSEVSGPRAPPAPRGSPDYIARFVRELPGFRGRWQEEGGQKDGCGGDRSCAPSLLCPRPRRGWGVCSASKSRVRSGKVESDLEWWAGKHPGPGLSGRSLVHQCIRRSVGWDASSAEKRGVRFR